VERCTPLDCALAHSPRATGLTQGAGVCGSRDHCSPNDARAPPTRACAAIAGGTTRVTSAAAWVHWRRQAPRLRGASTKAWAAACSRWRTRANANAARHDPREFCVRAHPGPCRVLSLEVDLGMSLSEDCGATSCQPRRRPALRQDDRNRPLWRPAVLPKTAEWRGEAARPCEQTWSTARAEGGAPATSGRRTGASAAGCHKWWAAGSPAAISE
jgi:hypothetical protein